MIKRLICICLVFGLYLGLFVQIERGERAVEPSISLALPTPVQRIVAGYVRDLAGEMLFVKAAIFLGLPVPMETEVYAPVLLQNFQVMTELNPEFKDPYFLCQSSLAYVAPSYAGEVNRVLDRGIAVHDEDAILPFFKGFNYYYYMKDNRNAAKVFAEVAKNPEVPSWIGHLASTLAAHDGDIYGGVMTLRIMHANEKDEIAKQRYADSLEKFEQAARVLEATKAFKADIGRYPRKLEEMIPGYILSLPVYDDYELLWTPPILRLRRPHLN